MKDEGGGVGGLVVNMMVIGGREGFCDKKSRELKVSYQNWICECDLFILCVLGLPCDIRSFMVLLCGRFINWIDLYGCRERANGLV